MNYDWYIIHRSQWPRYDKLHRHFHTVSITPSTWCMSLSFNTSVHHNTCRQRHRLDTDTRSRDMKLTRRIVHRNESLQQYTLDETSSIDVVSFRHLQLDEHLIFKCIVNFDLWFLNLVQIFIISETSLISNVASNSDLSESWLIRKTLWKSPEYLKIK